MENETALTVYGLEEIKLAVKSRDLALALRDIGNLLRSLEKYENAYDQRTIEHIRREFCNTLDEHDINLDNLIE